ncbi:MAG: hypothetical protein ACK43K_15215, partial [Chitinophagales bacterium]
MMHRYLLSLCVLFLPQMVKSATIEYIEYYNSKNQFILFEARKVQTSSRGIDAETIVSFNGVELNIRMEVNKENHKLFFYSTMYFDSSKVNSSDRNDCLFTNFNLKLTKDIGIADREANLILFKRLFPNFEAENYLFTRFEKVYYHNDRRIRREYFNNDVKTRTDYYSYSDNMIKLSTVNEVSLEIEKEEPLQSDYYSIKITKNYFSNGKNFYTSREKWNIENDIITRIGAEGDSTSLKKFSSVSKQAIQSQIAENFLRRVESLPCFKITNSQERSFSYHKNQNTELNIEKQVLTDKNLYFIREKNEIIGQLIHYNFMSGNEYANGKTLFIRSE